jgi:hypothetical protein
MNSENTRNEDRNEPSDVTADDAAAGGDAPLAPRGPRGTIRRDNPREQGTIGVGAAIRWFLANGYNVSLPIGEAERYDLVVEDPDGRLQRVEVKTTTYKTPRGRYVVQIKTCGGNQSWNGTVKHFDPTEVELLYVLTDDQEEYVIPTEHVRSRNTLSLSPEMARFRVAARGQPTEQLRMKT